MTTFGFTTSGSTPSSAFNFAPAQAAFSKAFAQLASGKRINAAADDAAGLAIAAGLAASITTISQASRNANDTVSALAIADGALGQVQELSTRLQELAITAANGTYSDEQRGALQAEYSALTSEIQRIGETTSFNGKQLFDGSTLTAQIGDASETLEVGGINLQELVSSVASQNIGTQSGAQSAISALEQFSLDLNSQQSGAIGTALARLGSVQNNLDSQRVVAAEALASIEDADIGTAVIEATRNKALLQYQTALIAQSSQLQASTTLALLG